MGLNIGRNKTRNIECNAWRNRAMFVGVNIGRNSRIRRAIIDSGVIIPESSIIGYDVKEDRARGYTITESGITVVPSLEQRMNNEVSAEVAAK